MKVLKKGEAIQIQNHIIFEKLYFTLLMIIGIVQALYRHFYLLKGKCFNIYGQLWYLKFLPTIIWGNCFFKQKANALESKAITFQKHLPIKKDATAYIHK